MTKSRALAFGRSGKYAFDPAELLDALPDPILAIGPDGTIVDANSAAEAFFEMGRTALARHRLSDMLPFGRRCSRSSAMSASMARPSTSIAST